jgi:hypothetical protein
MRGEALIALGLMCAGTPAAAADPWSVSEGVNGMSVSSDASTLTCNHGQCSIWELTRYADPSPSGVLSLRDLAYYDCGGLRTRTQLEIKLGVDNEVLKTVKANKETWSAVQPDTVGAVTLAFACNFHTADPEAVRSGIFDVAGRYFFRLAQTDPVDAAPTSAVPVAQPPLQAEQLAVQIAASPTEIGVRRAIVAFKLRYQSEVAGLEFQIEQGTAKSGPVFRALVEGFAADRDAQVLCDRLKANGVDCFIRSVAPSAMSSR